MVAEASRVAAYLHTRLLPETRGYFTVTAWRGTETIPRLRGNGEPPTMT